MAKANENTWPASLSLRLTQQFMLAPPRLFDRVLDFVPQPVPINAVVLISFGVVGNPSTFHFYAEHAKLGMSHDEITFTVDLGTRCGLPEPRARVEHSPLGSKPSIKCSVNANLCPPARIVQNGGR